MLGKNRPLIGRWYVQWSELASSLYSSKKDSSSSIQWKRRNEMSGVRPAGVSLSLPHGQTRRMLEMTLSPGFLWKEEEPSHPAHLVLLPWALITSSIQLVKGLDRTGHYLCCLDIDWILMMIDSKLNAHSQRLLVDRRWHLNTNTLRIIHLSDSDRQLFLFLPQLLIQPVRDRMSRRRRRIGCHTCFCSPFFSFFSAVVALSLLEEEKSCRLVGA